MSAGIAWAERRRIAEQARGERPWSLWGPYLSERQWGTVREDYSCDGNAWRSLTHDDARSRAYRWGEDGLAGLCDERGLLCFALGLWNGRDHILKERLFGLTNEQGNHGEDVKEHYHYLDAVPSHAYLKFLYRYPQAAYPYDELVREGLRRSREEPEYEIDDTGIFDGDRFFDVTVEYAKADVDDIHVTVSATNRGPEAADLHLVPQLWFRNTWSWRENGPRPRLAVRPEGGIACEHPRLGHYRLAYEGEPEIQFCENETNLHRAGHTEAEGPFKDGLHAAIVGGDDTAIRRDAGTKLGLHYAFNLRSGETKRIRLRLSAGTRIRPLDEDGSLRDLRVAEADAFYDDCQDGITDPDARAIFRQAAAGLIWSKQLYAYDVRVWLKGDPLQPVPPREREGGRNTHWRHFAASDILSMPDKWEYPWFAAWDLAFHCLPLALLDPDFAKRQLLLLTREWYMHPNGQLPAYEWEFSDTNPPVHAWAAYRVFEIDRARRGGRGDVAFLEGVFHKLLINFTWWVNRKDAGGRNVFQGGFLGLDNVGVFDRSRPPPGFGMVHQADGTAWMAMYALNMMRIALELAVHNDVYESTASKFFEHFLLIAEAMTDMGGEGLGLWDEDDEFYYDEVDIPGAGLLPLRVRSMVGLVPLFAVEVIEPSMLQRLPDFARRLNWLLENRPHLARLVSRWNEGGVQDRKLLSLLRGHRMKALLRRMLDEAEFLSPYGIRSLSKFHRDQPYALNEFGASFTVRYDPADSTSNMFGGNSNWRGPVWMPTNYLIIEALRRFYTYYGDDFLVEFPTGSGEMRTLAAIADALQDRLIALFTKDEVGRRPALGDRTPLPLAAGAEEALLFHEFFDGETGRGLGASHQTGWTALILNLLHHRARQHV
ncbi:glucosidase [Methylobacterium sp. J-030]|uniref:MGH1-like glycoside hydrolase domain-containing protein n=1 Tax=Methylobacterium sp. J-030 TaxID=2836627 RepID=UPI001FBA8C51|nr:glucosidase [Methylobacterium sp. J-030]MCJ2071808.1 glucosidase [Methylobacterium sp. J-030]